MSVLCRTLFATSLLSGMTLTGVASADTLEVGVHDTSVSVNGNKTIPIPLPVDGKIRKSEQHTISIGEGKHVVHVRVTATSGTWEAIVSGGPYDPVFAGVTGYVGAEEGDRTGQVVVITERDDASKFVLVGDVREDTRICGQVTTPVAVRALDPKTMTLRSASFQRIAKKDRDAAVAITAKPSETTPLARLLAAAGGTSGTATALTDGKADTAWSEERSGDGHGEFVSMRAPIEAPLHSLLVTTAQKGDAPRTFFVATDAKLFRVTLPDEAAKKPGATFEVPFPEPVKTSCLAVVLDEAFSDAAAPVVSLAEVAARTKLDVDGASLDDVVKELAGARADEAAAVLRRGGDAALVAVVTAWPKLDARARTLAVDVASSAGTCGGPAMELLTHALSDKDREVQKRAVGRIQRCGKNAIPSLADGVRSSDEERRAASATMLASVSGSAAWDPIAEQIGKGKPETRHAMRAALAKATAPKEKVAALLTRADLTPEMKLDALRALGPRLPEVKPEASAALDAILAGTPDFRTRYLALEPLAQLGDRARLVSFAQSDPEWPVRARAVELFGSMPSAPDTTLASALADPEPRVREAALRARVGTSALGLRDEWSFVRVAAADSMGVSKENPAALAGSLKDPSPKVRAAVVIALGNAGARGQAKAIRERLDDQKEDIEVRALAARTLGQLCVQDAADRLTKLALLAQHPVDEADERIGNAALDALAMLHPADIAKRLAPLREKSSRTLLKRAADLAVSAPGICSAR